MHVYTSVNFGRSQTTAQTKTTAVMTEFQQAFLLAGIHLGIALILSAILLLVSKSEKRYLLLVFAAFFVVTFLVLFIPDLPILRKLHWNWQGKFLTFILSMAFVYFLPFLTEKEAGFTFKVNKSVWIPLLILLTISAAFNIYVNDFSGVDKTKEYLFYQLTMPGLSEEPVFRGVMLGLLNLVFISRKKILGEYFGWGALIQTVLFGVGHAIYFDDKQHLQFYFTGFAATFVLGAFMTYLKEKGESLIPAILFHNLYNALLPLISLFM